MNINSLERNSSQAHLKEGNRVGRHTAGVQRRPMAKPRESLKHKAAVLFAKFGLFSIAATGGAGVAHHVTGFELPPPLPPVAGAADAVESKAVDAFVKLANDEPKQEQANIDNEKSRTDAMFKPTDARVGGEIEIEVSKLSEARTKDILLAIRMGNDYQKPNPEAINVVDGITVNEESRIGVENPLIVDLTSEGLGKNYLASVDGSEVIIPEGAVKLIVPGDITPLSQIESSDGLNVAKLLPQS